jgi:hypothetical protein
MKLNDKELKIVERLKKRHDQWLKRHRYFTLACGIILGIVSVFCLNYTKCFFNSPHHPWIGTAFFVQFYFFSAISGLLIGRAIFYWNGSPHDILLLKLIDDKIEKDSNG